MPTDTQTYNGQNGVTATGSYDPLVVKWIIKAARKTGADPVALLATALQESGAQRGREGDNHTSFGPFQFHIGGALGSHSKEWANTYAPILNRAELYASHKVHHGKGAAAIQLPKDQALYAKGVDSQDPRARAILHKMGLDVPGADLKLPDGTPAVNQPGFSVPGELPQTPSQPLLGGIGTAGSTSGAITLQGLMTSAKDRLGQSNPTPQKSKLLEYLMQQASADAPAPLKLPDGTTATTQPKRPATGAPDTSVELTPGGGWGGSQELATTLAEIGKKLGLKSTSEKRPKKLTSSGNPSDHWTGSKNSYAFDLSNGTETKQEDAAATAIAAALGVKDYHGGSWLNVTKGGYRYQLGWRVPEHHDHVHLGVKKV